MLARQWCKASGNGGKRNFYKMKGIVMPGKGSGGKWLQRENIA
jgi:hypothetical protein